MFGKLKGNIVHSFPLYITGSKRGEKECDKRCFVKVVEQLGQSVVKAAATCEVMALFKTANDSLLNSCNLKICFFTLLH